MDCDVLVIGSGFGGAVVACRAAERGARVIVLERGLWYTEERWEALRRGALPLYRVFTGPADRIRAARRPPALAIELMPRLVGLVGCGVGGGSLHYTRVTVAPRDEVFTAGWPADWTADSLRPYLARVAARLRPQVLAAPAPQTLALEAAARRVGCDVARLPLASSSPLGATRVPASAGARSDMVRWLHGTSGGAKTMLVDGYLRAAERLGAQIRPCHTVRRIGSIAGGYAVDVADSSGGRPIGRRLAAPRVVLAAGTLATVRLLLEARDVHGGLAGLSRALGARFTTNGDFGAMLLAPRCDVDPGAPPATAWLDCWDDERLFLMEMGAAPVFRAALARLVSWVPRRRGEAEARRGAAWMVAAMAMEESCSRLVLNRRGNMRHVPDGSATGPRRCLARLRELSAAVGAVLVALPATAARAWPATVHPLGGCVLADTPERGVCDPTGQAYGLPGLFVVDGSVLPTPTGCPPSMTIAAAAERISEAVMSR